MTSRLQLGAPRTIVGGAGLIVLGAICVQWAATLAVGSFATVSPLAVSGWRFVPGAIVLVAFIRPRPWKFDRRAWIGAVSLGVTTALMNLCFFQAISRMPLGSAVTIEYLGPFAVAVIGRRSWETSLSAVLAALGVVALTHPGSGVTLEGAMFAALAAGGWASYTFASHRVGDATVGFEGLAVAMVVASLICGGFSVASFNVVVSHGSVAAKLVAMSILAVVLGFGAELQALRRLTPRIASVLLALNPVMAFVVAWIVLSQTVTKLDIVGVVLICCAGVFVTARHSANQKQRDGAT